MANKLNIPFQPTSKEYKRIWARMKKGDTLEEAMADLTTFRKRGKKPVALTTQKSKTDQKVFLTTLKETGPQGTPISSAPAGPAFPLSTPPALPEDLGKKLDRLNTNLAEIARAMNRIADHLAPVPGMEGTVTMRQAPAPIPKIEQPVRATENGLLVGDKIRRTPGGEIGEIVRILPGKKDVEVKFLLGKKTLPVDQCQIVEGIPG